MAMKSLPRIDYVLTFTYDLKRCLAKRNLCRFGDAVTFNAVEVMPFFRSCFMIGLSSWWMPLEARG
jgi:hypothetical protein